MLSTDTIIIGGGISGLYSARRLQQCNIPYLLLEAKPELGGRIVSRPTAEESPFGVDLGPTWFWPHQQRIQNLLTQLNVERFEQYTAGDVLYQLEVNHAPRRTQGAGSMLSYRVHGGMQKVITSLEKQLNVKQLKPNHSVTGIERKNGRWQLTVRHLQSEKLFCASRLILALPPRMIVKYLTPEKWLSQALITDLNRQQSWMASQAKFVAVYSSPFWRQQGLAGQAFSRVGPMVEIHDASASEHNGFALFGFIGLPVSMRRELNEQQLKDKCLEQFTDLFGHQALSPQVSYLKDWSQDHWLTTDQDVAESPRHAEISLERHQQELSALNLHLVGSEFAQSEAGYIEGALMAVDESMQVFCG